MPLTLTVLRGPESVSPQSREIGGGEFSIGRAPDNDWVLPDPERHLSKRHCIVALRGGDWQVADLSSNGTFLNRDLEPVGAGHVRDLRNGDRLRLGAYEIEVRIADEARPPPAVPSEEPFADFDALLPNPEEPAFKGPVQADHTPRIEDAYQPPRPVALLDDDWDLDVAPSSARAPAPVAPPPAPVASNPPDAGLLAAFLRGAGLPDAQPTDPLATMEALGAAFRALVNGLRETLIARAAVKGEFRIGQTMVRARGNNPLKFSAGDDDAMASLLGTGRHIDMSAAEAIAEALRDIRLHELATVSAMQGAVRALLAELAPAKLAAAQSGLLPAQRKVRAWEAFEAQHARITQALSDDFDSAFGRAFARAYERALREAGSRG